MSIKGVHCVKAVNAVSITKGEYMSTKYVQNKPTEVLETSPMLVFTG